jgi:hypothetical protein
MKKLCTIILVFCISQFLFAQSITVETQKQFNTNFRHYKTYYFASQVDDQLDEGYFFLNDIILKSNIRNAVDAEMQGLGYKKNSASPDLIINFRLFDAASRIKGSHGYGSRFWSGTEVRQPKDTTSFLVKPGTLFISLIDRKKSDIVWQGFASGLIDHNEFIKDESKIKEAVNLIFNKYEFRAKK